MKNIARTIVCTFALSVAQIAWACEQPADMSVPDGEKASDAEMRAASRAYDAYMKSMQAYQDCLEADANQARAQSDQRNKQAINRDENDYVVRHNRASSAMVQVTEQFNEAIEEYEAGR